MNEWFQNLNGFEHFMIFLLIGVCILNTIAGVVNRIYRIKLKRRQLVITWRGEDRWAKK